MKQLLELTNKSKRNNYYKLNSNLTLLQIKDAKDFPIRIDVKYFNSIIMSVTDKSITFDSKGWKTRSTLRAMNKILKLLQLDKQLFVTSRKNIWLIEAITLPAIYTFFDGIEIDSTTFRRTN